MPSIRKCGKCSEPTLNPIERKLGIYNSTISYKCTNCGDEIELVPLGSLGVQMCIYLLLALIVWFIFIGNNASTNSVIIFVLLMSIMPVTVLFGISKHLKGPKIANGENVNIDVGGAKGNIFKKPINWVERKNFVVGLLSPLIFIGLILGIAAIIGYINFTFFQN